MPTFFEPKDLPVSRKDAAIISTLANRAMLGTDALQVEHILLEAGAKSSMFESVEPERFLYVIRGRGQGYVDAQAFPLEAESVLWLEKGDAFHLEAGPDGLEFLFCRAPGSE